MILQIKQNIKISKYWDSQLFYQFFLQIQSYLIDRFLKICFCRKYPKESNLSRIYETKSRNSFSQKNHQQMTAKLFDWKVFINIFLHKRAKRKIRTYRIYETKSKNSFSQKNNKKCLKILAKKSWMFFQVFVS